MSKTLRNTFVLILSLFALLSFAIFGAANGLAYADATTTTIAAPTGTATEALTQKIESLESFEISGTAVRTKTPWGMRFLSVISDTDLSKLPADAKFGTLIIPTDILGENELTVDLKLAANATAKVGYEGTGVESGYKGYTGVIIGTDENTAFPEADYARGFTAVGYVTYTYTDGEETKTDTIYTAKCVATLAGIADEALLDPDSGMDGNENLETIVNTAATAYASNVTVSTESAALRTGEQTSATVNGVADAPVTLEISGNDYAGYAANTTSVYGKKVGTGKITVTVKSTGTVLATSADVTVSAIEVVDKVDDVEFLLNDADLDFSTAVGNDALLGKALSAGNATLSDVDSTAFSIADNKITLVKPTTDTDAIYGEKFFVLTTVDGDIEYTVNFKANVAGFIVNDKTDLDNVDTVAKVADSNVWSGYVMLGADIDYEGGTFAGIAQILDKTSQTTIKATSADTGFRGVFDGNGHYITNLVVGTTTTTANGFFGAIGNGAVIKNIAFTNTDLEYSNALGSGFLAVFAAGCNITDVLIDTKIKYIYHDWFADVSWEDGGAVMGIAHTSADNPFVMKNSVLINNVTAFSIQKSYTLEYLDSTVSTSSGSYDNCLGITFAAAGTMATGLKYGNDYRNLSGHTSAGFLSTSLDTTKFNQKYWSKQRYEAQMSGYVLAAENGIWFFNNCIETSGDTTLLGAPVKQGA